MSTKSAMKKTEVPKDSEKDSFASWGEMFERNRQERAEKWKKHIDALTEFHLEGEARETIANAVIQLSSFGAAKQLAPRRNAGKFTKQQIQDALYKACREFVDRPEYFMQLLDIKDTENG